MARKIKEWERGRVIVFNADVCSGCRTCETVCALSHEGVANPRYSCITVNRHVLDVQLPDIITCAQCGDALCMQACRKNAISVDPVTKAKIINKDLCIGCGLCAQACVVTPSRIIMDKANKRALKCDLCGGKPKCVSLCPMGALGYEEVQ